MMVVIDLMMGVQGRISTTDGISAAIHHSPLIHESGRRDEAKDEQHKIHKPSPGLFILKTGRFFSVKSVADAYLLLFVLKFLPAC